MIILNRVLLMLGMFACSLTQKTQGNQHFELLQATSQQWVSGVRGGGSSINYKVTIQIKTEKPIQFDSIWIAGKKLNLKLEKTGQYDNLKLARHDIVTLHASDYTGNPDRMGRKEEGQAFAPPPDLAQAPIKYKGAALLRYFVDGSAKYFPLATIKAIPTIHGQ